MSFGGCESPALEKLVLQGVCIGIVSDSVVGTRDVELRPSAGGGHDSADDARKLQATGMA